jgi:hypothetical protein
MNLCPAMHAGVIQQATEFCLCIGCKYGIFR